MKKILKIIPVAKPRQTQSDRWKQRPAVMRYREFADNLRAAWGSDSIATHDIRLTFNVPMPATWSKKKKAEMDGQPHQAKPDIDNYLKAFLDAIFKLFDEDDCVVYDSRVSKYWAREGSIVYEEITIP